MRRLKIKIVGDGNVGKTCFLIRWYNDNFPPSPSENRPDFPGDSVPSVQDPFYSSLTVDRKSYVLTYWDTLRGTDYQKFRCMEYEETDVFLACFDIANPSSFQNVSTVWVPELKHYMPETPILVVGNKKDLRTSPGVSGLVSVSKGQELAARLGTVYLETSAKTGDGLREALVTAVRLATRITPPSNRGKLWGFQRKRKSSKGLRCGPDPPLLSPPGSVPTITVESSSFAEDLQKMLKTKSSCDVQFMFGNLRMSIEAHKMMLCAGSPAFQEYFLNHRLLPGLASLLAEESVLTSSGKSMENLSMFVAGLNVGIPLESTSQVGLKSSVVHLRQNVHRKAFESILEFLYTGVLSVPQGMYALPKKMITELAKSLELQELIRACQQNGEVILDSRNVPSVSAARGKMMKKLFLNKPELSDVTFCIENSKLYAHKALLMARSEVMGAMFGGSFTESDSTEIRIHDTTVPVFLAFLEYIYSDQIPEDVSITLYKELLVVADRFCLPRLINLCEQALCQQVGNELRMKPIPQPVCNQLIELLLFSQAYNAPQLAKWCLYIITTNYAECESCGKFDLIKGDNRRHVIEHRWPPLSYLKELEEFKRQTGRV